MWDALSRRWFIEDDAIRLAHCAFGWIGRKSLWAAHTAAAHRACLSTPQLPLPSPTVTIDIATAAQGIACNAVCCNRHVWQAIDVPACGISTDTSPVRPRFFLPAAARACCPHLCHKYKSRKAHLSHTVRVICRRSSCTPQPLKFTSKLASRRALPPRSDHTCELVAAIQLEISGQHVVRGHICRGMAVHIMHRPCSV